MSMSYITSYEFVDVDTKWKCCERNAYSCPPRYSYPTAKSKATICHCFDELQCSRTDTKDAERSGFLNGAITL